MAFTQNIEVNRETWTLLAEGMTTVSIQMQQGGNVLIHIADAATPPDDAEDVGIMIGRTYGGVANSLSAGGLQAGGAVNVWGKSHKDAAETVTVLAY